MREASIVLQKGTYTLGEEVAGTVSISLNKPVSVRSSSIYVRGKERTEVPYERMVHSGKTSHIANESAVEEIEFLHRELPMNLPKDEKGKIKPGYYDVPFTFVLPEGLPASYDGRHVKITYEVIAQIDVPLWLDVKESVAFEVVSRNALDRLSGPINVTSDSWGNPQKPGICFDLDRIEFCRGEVLSGRCDFRNPAAKNLRKIDVNLKYVETARARGYAVTTGLMSESSEIPVESRVVKGGASFSVRIPDGAPSTYETALSSVTCTLSLSLDIALGSDVSARRTIETAAIASGERELPPYHANVGGDAARRVSEEGVASEWCSHCGAGISAPEARYCPKCGSRLHTGEQETGVQATELKVKLKAGASTKVQGMGACIVCGGELGQDENVVWCPHCGRLAHRNHLVQWIRSKKTCPACGNKLSEEDYL